jgi:hypothetical protein
MARRKSATRETLILVDEAENVTGFEEKESCHFYSAGFTELFQSLLSIPGEQC